MSTEPNAQPTLDAEPAIAAATPARPALPPQCTPNRPVTFADLADTWIPWGLLRSPLGPR